MMKVRLLTLYIICLTCNLLTAQTVQWSVKPTYSSLEEYVGKLYKYRENGKVGLVDISGKVLVEAKYDSITPFIDYHALALDFQGGNYTFPMAKASFETTFSLDQFPEIRAGIVKWPLSVIRLVVAS